MERIWSRRDILVIRIRDSGDSGHVAPWVAGVEDVLLGVGEARGGSGPGGWGPGEGATVVQHQQQTCQTYECLKNKQAIKKQTNRKCIKIRILMIMTIMLIKRKRRKRRNRTKRRRGGEVEEKDAMII
jgi:hypothetical protein